VNIGAIDLMPAEPGEDTSHCYHWVKPTLMDRPGHEIFKMSAG